MKWPRPDSGEKMTGVVVTGVWKWSGERGWKMWSDVDESGGEKGMERVKRSRWKGWSDVDGSGGEKGMKVKGKRGESGGNKGVDSGI